MGKLVGSDSLLLFILGFSLIISGLPAVLYDALVYKGFCPFLLHTTIEVSTYVQLFLEFFNNKLSLEECRGQKEATGKNQVNQVN